MTIPLVTAGSSCTPACRDNTPPGPVRVQYNLLGDLQVARAPKVDPYVITVDGVEPGARLQLLDVSKNPNAQWGKDEFLLPGSTLNLDPKTGQYGLGLQTETAASLGLKAGRDYLIRQVDRAGNAGPEALTYIRPENMSVVIRQLDGELTLAAGRYDYIAAPDTEAPQVLTQNMKFERNAENDGYNLVINAGVEFYATVGIVNGRTNQEWTKKLMPDIFPGTPSQQISRRLEIPFGAEIGDPFKIWVRDLAGNTTTLPLQFLEC